MLILLESICMCFVMVIVCVVGIRIGAEKFVAFYEKNVQKNLYKSQLFI